MYVRRKKRAKAGEPKVLKASEKGKEKVPSPGDETDGSPPPPKRKARANGKGTAKESDALAAGLKDAPKLGAKWKSDVDDIRSLFSKKEN